MATRYTVAKVGELADGEGMTVRAAGKAIALFRDGDAYLAIDDMCPHMGASLSGGHVEGGVVTCPWHAWRFRLSDGCWMDNKRIKIGSYAVSVDGEDVRVELPDPPAPPASEGTT